MVAGNSTDFTGQQFGNYELEGLLKHRVVTDLYRARDVKLDQPAFVEVLRYPVSENPELAGRFQRRMEAVSQIKSANIAPVIETGVTDDDYAYAVIEYIPGVWLSDILAEWHESNYLPPVNEALALGREIADALSSSHPAGLIHHDLRPENILISDAGNIPVLIDLGVPITINGRNGALNDARSNMLDYASPEELEGKSIGRRSNIYSLGIILYELLTGHRPELPSSSWDIFEHSAMPKEMPLEEAREGLSGETYRLVRNCLWRQEWSRFETADEVISAIDTAVLAEQSEPKAVSWSNGRNRWLYFAVPALAIVVLVAGLVLLWSQFVSAEPQEEVVSPPAVVADPTGDATSLAQIAAGAMGESTRAAVDSEPTAIPTATVTRQAPPTSAMDTTIPVFGPLADQVFQRDEIISFAWIWLSQPEPGELFTVYIEPEDVEAAPIAVGAVATPDNASLYRLDTSAAQLDLPAGSYLWQVRLENLSSGEMIVESDARRILVAAQPTSTPTTGPATIAATATAVASATPSVTATAPPAQASATAASCVPQQPFGWVRHSIQPGETISLFASRANVPVERILEANCLSRSAVLSVGQQIYIPAPPVTPTFTPRPTQTPGPAFTPGPVPTEDGGGSGGGGNGGGNGGGSTPEPTDEPPPRPTKTPVGPPEG